MTNNPLLSDAVVKAVARAMCAYEHTDYAQYSKIMRDAAKDALTAAHKALTDAGFVVVPGAVLVDVSDFDYITIKKSHYINLLSEAGENRKQDYLKRSGTQ